MKKMRRLCALLLAFAMLLGVAGGLARPAWAADKVSGGETRETATAIECNKKYTVYLSGKNAAYFKFTTPAGDFDRYNVWLNVPKDSNKYGGKFFAFFGSAERVDNPDHKQWESTVYGEKFPLLFCAPATTYYLWICGGEAGRKGNITFQMVGSEDDADYLDGGEAQLTPLTLSRKTDASIDTRDEKKEEDQDLFSFHTGNSSMFGITVQYKEAMKGEGYSDFKLKAEICEYCTINYGMGPVLSLDQIGRFTITEGKTEKFLIELEENKEYVIRVSPYDYVGEPDPDDMDEDNYYGGYYDDDDEEEDPDLALYGKYALRVDTLKQKPWEIESKKPTSITLSKKVRGEFDIDWSPSREEPVWYTFTTGKAGRYRLTTKREEHDDLDEIVLDTDLQVMLYDASGKKLGGYSVKEGKTEKASFKLKEKTKYYFKVVPTGYSLEIVGDSYYDPDTCYFVWAGYSCLVAEEPDLANANVTYTKKWTYAGKAVKPAVKVTYGGKTLKKGTDYTVAYANNKKCGKGKITITGIGGYGGSKNVYFAIYPKKQVITSLKSTKAKKATVAIAEDTSVAGYQICYALTKDFKKSKTVASVGASKTLSLTSGKTYYVRVRGVASYGSKEIYGAWSDVKSVKVK